jgi:hypothetical protein
MLFGLIDSASLCSAQTISILPISFTLLFQKLYREVPKVTIEDTAVLELRKLKCVIVKS